MFSLGLQAQAPIHQSRNCRLFSQAEAVFQSCAWELLLESRQDRVAADGQVTEGWTRQVCDRSVQCVQNGVKRTRHSGVN